MNEARDSANEMAWHGDLAPARALASKLARSDPEQERAWSLLVRAHEHQAGVGVGAPTLASLAMLRHAPDAARGTAALAVALVARDRMLAFDRTGLDAALVVLESLERGSGSLRAGLWLEVTHLWCDLLSGRGAGHAARLDALATTASRERFAELVIEVNVLRAMAMLDAGDLEGATQHARRVSRMARAEGVPHEEVLASFLLARVRRLGGRAHLASRILNALWSVAPSAWRPWLAWELRLCGDARPDGVAPGAVDRAEGPGAQADALIDAFVAGDVEAVEAHRSAVSRSVSGFAAAEREASVLIGALDPRVDVAALGPGLAAWATGGSERLPLGLDSVVSSVATPHAELAGHSWVLVSPGAPARRFLHPGLGVVRGAPLLEQTTRRHGRTETATAVLALAGAAGIAMRRFVPEVYGFPYSRDAHDGVLRVLLHRMRKSLESVATIERSEDHVVLRSLRPFVVPDPRTCAPSSDRVLRMIATRPGASARDVAGALAMPLRTVQATLTQLVADGSCMTSRTQGGVEYRLEDTTFSDATSTGAAILGTA